MVSKHILSVTDVINNVIKEKDDFYEIGMDHDLDFENIIIKEILSYVQPRNLCPGCGTNMGYHPSQYCSRSCLRKLGFYWL